MGRRLERYGSREERRGNHIEQSVRQNLDLSWVKKQLRSQPPEYDQDAGMWTQSYYVGSVMSLFPSGKFYTPWATSNLDLCPDCQGKGKVPIKVRCTHCCQGVYEVLAGYNLAGLSEREGREVEVGDFVTCQSCRGKGWFYQSCLRCEGSGSHEATEDERFRETLEELLGKHGIWMSEGEGDPTDVFFGWECEAPEGAEVDDESEVCLV